MESQPNPVKLPLAKYPVDRVPVGKLFGKKSPLTPCAGNIHNSTVIRLLSIRFRPR